MFESPVVMRSLVQILLGLALSTNAIEQYPIASQPLPPSTITIRASVLANTVPLAYIGGPNDTAYNPSLDFPTYLGFLPDVLRLLQTTALQQDNVTLRFALEESPPFAYDFMLQHLYNTCNSSDAEIPLEDCYKFDMVIGDYYPLPDRSLHVRWTPPLLETAAGAVRTITTTTLSTLDEADATSSPICVMDYSIYDVIVMAQYPNSTFAICYDYSECQQMLRNQTCVLFADDELQLRYLSVQDDTLQLTPDRFAIQYITLPYSANIDPVIEMYMTKWIYDIKTNGKLNELYDSYFSIFYCPIGYAGLPGCDQPCSPAHGKSNRYGVCVCESIKWTGPDCATEVFENHNAIPSSILIIAYTLLGINYIATVGLAGWLYAHRTATPVKVAQPFFLGMVLIGCFISTSTILALGQQDVDANGEMTEVTTCMAIPWLYAIGFSITFGTLFAKIRRVYHIFKAAARMQRVIISIQETMYVIAAVLAIDFIILAVWTVIDPLQWKRTILTMDEFQEPLSSEGHCTSDHWSIFATVIAVWHFILMGIACYMCYMAKDVPTQFSEGKYVAIAMISNLQIFVVGLPVLIILGTDTSTSFFVRSIIIWMNDFVVLALIFGNLIYSVHYGPEQNQDVKQCIRSSIHSFAMGRGSNHGVPFQQTRSFALENSNSNFDAGGSNHGPGSGSMNGGGSATFASHFNTTNTTKNTAAPEQSRKATEEKFKNFLEKLKQSLSEDDDDEDDGDSSFANDSSTPFEMSQTRLQTQLDQLHKSGDLNDMQSWYIDADNSKKNYLNAVVRQSHTIMNQNAKNPEKDETGDIEQQHEMNKGNNENRNETSKSTTPIISKEQERMRVEEVVIIDNGDFHEIASQIKSDEKLFRDYVRYGLPLGGEQQSEELMPVENENNHNNKQSGGILAT